MNDDEPTAEASSSRDPPTESPEAGQDGKPTAKEVAERRKKNRQMFNKKRGLLLDDLLYSLDVLVYAELSAIYYMDCSFWRFMIRALIQFVLLTPKPESFPTAPDQQPYVPAILGSNALCIFLHLWLRPAAGSEATRGYLHGGLAMDFIGQEGSVSRFMFMFLDLLVLSLQLVHLSASVTRRRLKEPAPGAPTAATQPAPPAPASQDLDSEERGIRRSAELEQQESIEMQELNPSGQTPDRLTEGSNERDTLLASTAPRSDAHIFDAFSSGQIVLADLDVWKTTKEQFWAYQKSSPESREVRRSTYRAHLAGRLMALRIATGRMG